MHPQNNQSLESVAGFKSRLNEMPLSVREGRLSRVSGLLYEVHGLPILPKKISQNKTKKPLNALALAALAP